MQASHAGRRERPQTDGFDRRKFQVLVHYVVWACTNRFKLSTVRLNRILWIADGRAYAARGHTITGAVYVRRGFGPAAAGTQDACAELMRQGLIEAVRDSALAGRREIFRSGKRPDSAAFDAEELGHIEAAIREVGEGISAMPFGRARHAYAWELARKGEVIPPHAILALRARPPSPRQIERARSAARELGLMP